MIILFLLLLFSLFSYIECPLYFDSFFIITHVGVCFFALFVVAYAKEPNIHLKKQFLKHSNFYVLGYLIVFYQSHIDYLLGFLDESNEQIWISSSVVCRSIALANIGLIAFFIGYLMQKKRYKSEIPTSSSSVSYDSVFKVIRILEYVMIILLFLYFVLVDKNYLFGGYGIVPSEGEWASFISKVFIAVFVFILCVKTLNFRKQGILGFIGFAKCLKLELISALLYICGAFLCGARHQAINLIMMILLSYILVTKKKLPLMNFFLLGVLCSVFLSLLGLIRGSTFDTSSVAESFDNLLDITSFSPFTQELSRSVNTLHCALFYVPEYYPYNIGLTIYGYIFLLIPGGRSLYLSVVGVPEFMHSSSQFITFLRFGFDPPYGLGSSSVADIYISFGLIGVLFVFLLFGRIVRFWEDASFSEGCNSIYTTIFSFVVYSQIFFISRESLFSVLFGVSYPLLLAFFVCKINSK